MKLDEIQAEKDEKEAKILKFYGVLDKSQDLSDNLDEFANFLKEFTGATGVYIGRLGHPKREIQEDDDDSAHLDEEKPKIIHFVQASLGHEFMVGEVLRHNQGISHDVFFVKPTAE